MRTCAALFVDVSDARMTLAPAPSPISRTGLRKAIGEKHPVLLLLESDNDALPKDQEAWKQFLKAHPDLEDWLKTIETEGDVFPTLRYMLRKILKFEEPEKIPIGNPFENHFATQIPILRLG